MRPVNTDGQSWGAETSNLALQDLRSKAIVDLNKRDEHLSRGRLSKANGYSPYREVPRKDGRGTNLKVDPVLSEIKHTGDETLALTKSRWAEFCEVRQDEKPFIDRLVTHTREKQLAEMKAAGEEVANSLSPVPEAEMPVLAPEPKPEEPKPVPETKLPVLAPPKAKPETKEPALVG